MGPRNASARHRYHAVSIVARPPGCSAAVALRDRRFLSSAAPKLPLPGCSRQGACKCVFEHHADRRIAGRRAEESRGQRQNTSGGKERRSGRGRRETD